PSKPIEMPKPVEAALRAVEAMKPVEAAKPAPKPEAIIPPAPVAMAAAAREAPQARSSRFILLAASVALAGAAAAMAGALAAAVTPAQQAAVALQSEPARSAVIDGWVVRHVNRGVALIQGRRMGVIEVETGDIVPGVGRIESIRRQDGRWVVMTSRGMIMSAL